MSAMECAGSDRHQSVQRGLRQRAAGIAAHPGLANGGRILNILEPDACG